MKQFGLIFIFLWLAAAAAGQSVNQEFPAPVLTNEISQEISARDIGDARLTRHFYVLYADTGDLNLSIETANFDGDFDLFEAATFRPIAKITVYAAENSAQTSRQVYFRRRTKIVLRVEGRSPNDDPARYRVNFGGSFAAAIDLPQPPEDLEPKTSGRLSNTAVARVNSAGAIIEVIPKPEAAKTETETAKSSTETSVTAPVTSRATRNARTGSTARRNARRATAPKIDDSATKVPENVEANPASPEAVSQRPPRAARNAAASKRAARNQSIAKAAKAIEPKLDPLANVRLVVMLKDGYKIERPMSEILRVSVDKGTLVVIAKNGKIERFAILDVFRFTIEQ